MKIAVIGIRGLPANYGGFETCAENVSKNWVENGHEVLVYCRKNRYSDRNHYYNGVRLKYTSSVRTKSLDTISNTFFSIMDLILFESGFKYVHLYNTGNALFLPLLKLFGKKVIISVDGIEWKREKWGLLAKTVHKLGEKISSLFADKIVVDNKEVQNYYDSTYACDTALIAYGAKLVERNADMEKKVLEKYGLQAKKYFLFVGRLVPEKGVHNLIRTYNQLQTELPLVIIGDDNPTKYRDDLFNQQSEKIKFLGFIYNDEYEQLLINSLIYVSASELEGTSPSLLSAMGGKVCSLVNGIEENLYTIEDSAYSFRKNDFDDFRKLWQSLISQPAKIEDMADKGYQHVQNNYRWEKIANQYIETFQQV